MEPIILVAIACAVLTVWCIILTVLLAQQKQFFRLLSKGVTKKDLVSILRQIAESLQSASTKIEALEKVTLQIKSDNRRHLQKVGFVRFNPFSDTGGDQSFCLCLLEQDNNGIVITSLHSRDTTRLYAKEIKNDALKQDEFSHEEWTAYETAKKSALQ